MKNTVSFETASLLKAAGFPQPEPEFGQVWYERNETLIIGQLSKASKARHCILNGQSHVLYTDDFFVTRLIFAPTAADILGQLPEKALMFRGGNDFHVGIQNGHYKADEWGWQHLSRNDNPAEAAAIAWLSIHEKDLHK